MSLKSLDIANFAGSRQTCKGLSTQRQDKVKSKRRERCIVNDYIRLGKGLDHLLKGCFQSPNKILTSS
jgi:hypothetical protein